jgi:hypothetical protein
MLYELRFASERLFPETTIKFLSFLSDAKEEYTKKLTIIKII